MSGASELSLGEVKRATRTKNVACKIWNIDSQNKEATPRWLLRINPVAASVHHLSQFTPCILPRHHLQAVALDLATLTFTAEL